ncbi:lipocalin-like domain-containing protein [Kribbella sp. VKM Ac-2566]|uniref:lipocalin-like domain-containing protein n=1 Tax=Kribbella sp. VKM Ac-2566 TaxID=2512218 RepID=UPI00106302CB|nr:lipocalin-like domain-containing protein [Kribbella sp. VKM Ac-2566]
MPLLDGTSYYSLPSLATRGTLKVNNRTYPVTGESWITDREFPYATVLHPDGTHEVVAVK